MTSTTINWIPIEERVPTKADLKDEGGYWRCMVIAQDWDGPQLLIADFEDYGDSANDGRIDWMLSIPGWSRLNVSHWAPLPDVSMAKPRPE